MANAEHVALLRKGCQSWNEWRRDYPAIAPDLRAAHLPNTTLRDLDLSGAILSIAVLRGADLTRADLSDANLSSANLGKTILYGANLNGADLRGAVWRGADLRMANLRGVDVRSGILAEANLEGADLSGADLGSTLTHDAKNLSTEQLCSVRSLWLTELQDLMSLVEQHCPHLLERPPD